MLFTNPVVSVFLLLLLLASNISNVFADEANDYFEQGVAAARRDDFQGAVRAFETAKRAGLNSSALYYNLGAIYYRMKVYAWSEDYFSRLTNDKNYSALAYYNLGLIAASKDNIELAIQRFQTCFYTTSDPKLKELSELAIKRLRHPEQPLRITHRKKQFSPPWNGVMLLSIARDDNVGLDNDETKNVTGISEKRDNYYEALLTTHGFVSGNRQGGFSLAGFAVGQKYSTESISKAYDYSQYHIALNRETMVGNWQLTFGLGYDRAWFGRTDFQRLYGVFLKGKRFLDNKKYIRMRFTSYKITDNVLYQYLDGYKHQMKFDFTVPREDWKFRIGYSVELNNRRDFESATTYSSYSPLRNTLDADFTFDIGKSWQSRFEIQYRNSIYRHDDVLDISANNSYSRMDNRYQLNAGLIYNFSPNWQVNLDYGFTRNDSNHTDLAGTQLSDYRRSLVSASLVWYY